MTHISNRQIDPKTKRHILDTLDSTLGKLKRDEIRMFLFSLMSATERLMIAKRFMAIVLLQQGLTDNEVAETLKITRSTVHKLGMQMKIKEDGFALAAKKIDQDKRVKEIQKLFIGLARYSIKAAGGRV